MPDPAMNTWTAASGSPVWRGHPARDLLRAQARRKQQEGACERAEKTKSRSHDASEVQDHSTHRSVGRSLKPDVWI